MTRPRRWREERWATGLADRALRQAVFLHIFGRRDQQVGGLQEVLVHVHKSIWGSSGDHGRVVGEQPGQLGQGDVRIGVGHGWCLSFGPQGWLAALLVEPLAVRRDGDSPQPPAHLVALHTSPVRQRLDLLALRRD